MKLYFSPGSCSLAPHILLRETGITCTLERVDLATHRLANGSDFYDITPRGQVPVLELPDGQRLTEGAVIAQYITEAARRDDLLPAVPSPRRYRVLEWQNYISAELHKSYTPLFSRNFSEATRDEFRLVLRRKYEWVNQQIQAGRYLTGDTFTVADAYLFTITRWAGLVGLNLDGLNNLQVFQAQVAARPAVSQALSAETSSQAAA